MKNDQLTIFLESLKIDIINSMQAKGKYATGQTAQQITVTGDDDNYQLSLPAYMQALEDGRSPTGKDAIKGNPPMIDRIRQWCQAKGIPDKAAWAIKKSIDQKGYPGTPGILSEPLSDDNINMRLDPAANALADAIAQQILASIGLTN